MKSKIFISLVLLMQTGWIYAQSRYSALPDVKKSNKWINAGNVRLNYYEQGSSLGIPVIFIHGYTDSKVSFEMLMRELPPTVHAYAISMRGFGDSFKPDKGYAMENFSEDLFSFMTQLNIPSAVIVGHSMGTIIAQRFALDHPEKIRALVLMNGFVSFSRSPASEELPDYIAGMKTVTREFAEEFQRSSIYRKVDSVYFEKFVDESMKVPLHVWQQTMKSIAATDFTNLIEFIHQPVLIIRGEQDQVSTKEEAELMRSSLSNAELIIYKGVGHTPHWEDPKQTAKDILRFLLEL
ncbi:alpha/beta hydrolase [Pollutibacter soli]|uniref:alpha/beta fold hydrolase n=1 Tax=Pollutibacter soli TaxID=3034157 RepID=UPI0030139C33